MFSRLLTLDLPGIGELSVVVILFQNTEYTKTENGNRNRHPVFPISFCFRFLMKTCTGSSIHIRGYTVVMHMRQLQVKSTGVR